MKEIVNNYKEIFISFIKNKKYIVSIIFVAILSYGFTITNYSIGVDDLCFDRYVEGTYILSAKRWGTWLLYNVLNITTFSPFWLDFIVATLMCITAIVVCTIIKKIVKDKINIWGYIIFSAIFISNPLISQFFMYQSTNLTVVISNLIAICAATILFENAINIKNKKSLLLPSVLLILAISMYEACIQTFLVMLFILLLIKTITDKMKFKEMASIIGIAFVSAIIGTLGYFVIGKIIILILDRLNMFPGDFANHSISWIDEGFLQADIYEKFNMIYANMINPLLEGVINYLPVRIFAIATIIAVLICIFKAIKQKQYVSILLMLGIILSNFILIVLQITVMYRIQFSWLLTIGFLGMYIFMQTRKNTILKYITSIILLLLIIIQTNNINNEFYEEHKRFEKEKYIANEIGMDVIECENYEQKKVIFHLEKLPEYVFDNNIDNKTYVLTWGTFAFREYVAETTKFINNFGYDIKPGTMEEYARITIEYEDEFNDNKDKKVFEINNYIIVNLYKYFEA